MKHEITPFNYNGTPLSTVTDEHGEIWFVAKEVAEILGYTQTNSMNKLLDDSEKKKINLRIGGNYQNQSLISESGLYSAIFGSTLEGAKVFKKWVTSEVLPTIRKTGKYESGAKPSDKPTDKPVLPAKIFPDYFRIARLIGCDRNAAAISANNAVFKKTGENVLELLGHTALEAEKQELIFNVSDLTEGISGTAMNKLLASAGLQHREGDRWVPDDGGKYSRILDTGKRHSDGTMIQQVKWVRSVLDLLPINQAA
jgi:prophage antirepressor-like protein